jgi:hypothetical protein
MTRIAMIFTFSSTDLQIKTLGPENRYDFYIMLDFELTEAIARYSSSPKALSI